MTNSSSQTKTNSPIGIIGGGIAGLAAAHTFMELGHEVTVFDKGRGPGGRTSSRRVEPFAFDHGAQYFTARDPDFRELSKAWIARGVVARWEGRILALRGAQLPEDTGETERLVGVPRMSALARHLADGVSLKVSSRVTSVERGSSGWSLSGEEGRDLGEFSRLLITAPPAQAAALLGDVSPLGKQATSINMQPCWAVLLGLAAPYEVPFDGAFCENSALSWVARNNSKPGRPDSEAWVLHASAAWSQAHLDEPREVVVDLLVAALEKLSSQPLPDCVYRDAHLWRYAQPSAELQDGYLIDRKRGVALAGDAYCGGRVEGAYMSGFAAARALAAN